MLALKQQGSGSLAILHGKQAVNAFQEVRGNLKALDSAFQQSYLKSHEDAYRSLADLLISQGRLSEAEKVLELLKEEEFNRIRRNGPDKPTIGLTSTEAEAAKVSDQLASLAVERGPLLAKIAANTATDRDRQRLDVIETAITEANKQIKLVLADVATGSPDERLVTQQSQSMMQSLRRLGNGTVALYTVITNDKGWVILTTPDFRRAYPVRTTDLNKAISEFRLALTSDRYDPADAVAAALRRAVPAEERSRLDAGGRSQGLRRQDVDVVARRSIAIRAHRCASRRERVPGRALPQRGLHHGESHPAAGSHAGKVASVRARRLERVPEGFPRYRRYLESCIRSSATTSRRGPEACCLASSASTNSSHARR